MKGVPLALAFLLTLCANAAAQVPNPGCTSRPEGAAPLFLGVTTQIVGIACPAPEGNFVSTAHVIRVDLSVPGLSFEASSAPSVGSFSPTLTTTFLATTRSQIAINANLLIDCCTDTLPPAVTTTALQGLEISSGKVLSPFRNNSEGHGKQPYPFATSLIVAANGLRNAILPSPRGDDRGNRQPHFGVGRVARMSRHQIRAAPTASSAPTRARWPVCPPTTKCFGSPRVDRLSENSGVTLPQAAQFIINSAPRRR